MWLKYNLIYLYWQKSAKYMYISMYDSFFQLEKLVYLANTIYEWH
jgi:hypothetical protein